MPDTVTISCEMQLVILYYCSLHVDLKQVSFLVQLQRQDRDTLRLYTGKYIKLLALLFHAYKYHAMQPQEAYPLWKIRVIQNLNEIFWKENEIKTSKTTLETLNAIFRQEYYSICANHLYYTFIYSNVQKYQENDIFRHVRVSSEQFTSKVWQYSYVSQFLARSGWVQVSMYNRMHLLS